MRPRSKKMARIYIARRKLVAELLQDAICVRCESAEATEVHEVLTRARGGSILDKDNCVPLCHSCHSYITLHPKEAVEEGFMKNSWDR
jgi:hypothetical protein